MKAPAVPGVRGAGKSTSVLHTRGRVLRHAASVYDVVQPIVTLGQSGRRACHVADLVSPRSGERVLDVGCGTGTLAWEIAKRLESRGEVVGIDASPSMIRVARRKRSALHCRHQVALAENLPFPDRHFDAVCSGLFFHHVDAELKRQSLNEIVRVLRPGGRVVIEDIGPPYTLLGAALAYGAWICLLQPEIRENIKGLLPCLMKECGLSCVEERGRHSGYIITYSAVKKGVPDDRSG